MSKPLIVINKAGGAGAEGFLDVKSSANDPHKLIITLSNLFTTPLATGVPFNWKDLTPVSMLALDEFILWVNAELPYKTAKEYLDAVKAGTDGQFKMGGTGSKQEDQIITVALEKVTGKKFTYVPYKGGGEVAVQLVGNHSTRRSTTRSRPWRSGAPARFARYACSTTKRLPYKDKHTRRTMAWADIPTCKEGGVSTVDYLMLRGPLHAVRRQAGSGRLLREPLQESSRGSRLPSSDRHGSFSALSSHLRYSAPVMEVWLNAPCSMNSFQSGVCTHLLEQLDVVRRPGPA